VAVDGCQGAAELGWRGRCVRGEQRAHQPVVEPRVEDGYVLSFWGQQISVGVVDSVDEPVES
jgi:hypothetical protein